METFDWKKQVKINILSLKLLGLWPKANKMYRLNVYSIYATFCLTFLLFTHTFVQTFNIYFILDDLEAFTSSIFVTFSCLGGVAKVYYLLQNIKILRQLFINISDNIFQPKTEIQKRLITPNIQSWKFFYAAFWIMCFSTTFFWSCYPIIDKWVAQNRLPFLAWYPYNSEVSPFYEVTYIHQVVSIWYVVFAGLNIGMLICALNMFIGAQCDILCDDLKKLGNGGSDIKIDLVRCINHHRAILRFSEKSNKFFNWMVSLQFFTSAISVGFTLFQLTITAPFTGHFYSFICYGTAITLETFVYCWFGNEVEIKSSAIPYAVFKCGWIGTPLNIQKSIIIFIIRSQRPIRMSAHNLFYLTLDTFKKILRNSWSYFALLNQVDS